MYLPVRPLKGIGSGGGRESDLKISLDDKKGTYEHKVKLLTKLHVYMIT